MNRIKIITLLLVLLSPLISCLEDISDPLLLKYHDSGDLISYVETRTDILNGKDQPLLLTVDELSQNLGSYLVIDIRTKNLFENGHIPGAVHVEKSDVLKYMRSISANDFNKIVLISNTGQVASYVSCLLIIAGYKNIYPLDRGMTYWNSVFSDELRDGRGDGYWWFIYKNFPSYKPPRSIRLPSVQYSGEPANIDEKVTDRIETLLKIQDYDLSISSREFSDSWDRMNYVYDNYFLVYTLPDSALHLKQPPGGKPRSVFGPYSVVFYDAPWDYQSSEDLLTLPLNKNILLYSPNGQRASFYQAYLHFIGYTNTKTIRYGAISILDRQFIDVFYVPTSTPGKYKDTVYTPTYLTPYGFWEDEIRNFSFETGP